MSITKMCVYQLLRVFNTWKHVKIVFLADVSISDLYGFKYINIWIRNIKN